MMRKHVVGVLSPKIHKNWAFNTTFFIFGMLFTIYQKTLISMRDKRIMRAFYFKCAPTARIVNLRWPSPTRIPTNMFLITIPLYLSQSNFKEVSNELFIKRSHSTCTHIFNKDILLSTYMCAKIFLTESSILIPIKIQA